MSLIKCSKWLMLRLIVCAIVFVAIAASVGEHYLLTDVAGTTENNETNLAGWWSFDEGKGEIVHDKSSTSNDGIIAGAKWTEGKVGSGLSFNGIDDYVNCGNNAGSGITGAITLEAWVKLNTLNQVHMIMDKKYTSAWDMSVWSNNRVMLRMTIDGTLKEISPSADVWQAVTNRWYHFACVYDGSNVYLYIDGTQIGSVSASGAIATGNSNLVIGADYGGTGYFLNGTIDEVRIYKRALSSDEIAKRYTSAVVSDTTASPFRLKAEKDKPMRTSETSKPTAASRVHTTGWKWDVIIYDRPGWSAAWLEGVELLGNDEIIIRLTANKEGTYFDDFYGEVSDTITISSTDGGMTWNETLPDRFPAPSSGVMTDGSMIEVDYVNALSPEEEARRRKALEQAGLGHLADNTGWLIFPESMAEELKTKGYDVFDQHPAIPEGQVAVYASKLRARRSTDGGKTWTDSVVAGALVFGHGPVFYDRKGFIKLPDGTILKSFYGSKLSKRDTESYVVRSTDQGETWQTIKISSTPGIGFNETEMVAYPDGRVVTMIRTKRNEVGYSTSGTIHSTISDDMGLTWRPAVDTKIKGYPLRLLLLKSGNILCTYCYRDVPGGARACISYDRGETWDYENEIILKDDAIATNWISPAGPMSVQLSDGTIFTAYTVVKVNEVKPGDLITDQDFKVHRDPWHSYLVGNRYTGDYVRPLPWKKK